MQQYFNASLDFHAIYIQIPSPQSQYCGSGYQCTEMNINDFILPQIIVYPKAPRKKR